MSNQTVAELDRLCELPQVRIERVGQKIVFRIGLKMPTAIFGHIGIVRGERLLGVSL